MKRRRLSDLYVRGKDLEIDDGAGDPVPVRLQKLNDIDRETILRRSNAAKARFMIDADDEESETFQAMYVQIREFPRHEGLVAVVIGEDVAAARLRYEEQAAHDENGWGKDEYLQGLFDAWTGIGDEPGLVATQVEDPEDPEVKRVWAELERFEDEIGEQVKHEVERLERDWVECSDEQLWRAAAHKMLQRTADEVFTREYERQLAFFAVRDPDQHRDRYFETVTEVDDLDTTVRSFLTQQYNAMLVDVLEGKDLGAGPDSLDSSAPTATTSEPSGLEVVNA